MIESNFTRNVLTLITGSTIAQCIPIVTTPILTRLYTPEEFGVLALFVAITATLGSVITGRYELAIMLPDNDEDAINVAALALAVTLALSFIIAIPIIIFNQRVGILLNNEAISTWLFFSPLVIFFIGFFNVLTYLNTRKKNYHDMARASIYKSVALSLAQIVLGFLKSGASGLIIGQIISHFISNFQLSKKIQDHYQFNAINSHKMRSNARRYIDFPKFSVWGVLANSLAFHLNNIFISLFYNLTILGFFSMTQRILSMPTSVIGNSVGQVYFEVAKRERQQTGVCINSFLDVAKKLVILVLVGFLPVFFLLPNVFEIFLGNSWRIAGEYSQIILPLIACQFVCSTLSNTTNIFEKQKLALLFQMVLLGLNVAVAAIAVIFNFDFLFFLKIYSAVGVIYYLTLFSFLYRIARAEI